MSRDADRLRDAFESRRLDQLIALMDPEVTWRGVNHPRHDVPLCRDRDEVREVMSRAMPREGHRRPVIIGESGNSNVVDPGGSPRSGRRLHQVITFRAGRIVLMQDFANRAAALAAIEPDQRK